MNPIAGALASKPVDGPRKAALFELAPLGASVALGSLTALAWLVSDQTDLPTVVAFALGLVFVVVAWLLLQSSVLSGLGWISRGRNWIGAILLFTRAVLSFVVFVEFSPDANVVIGLIALAVWIAMPIASACLVSIVPARDSNS